MELTPWEAEAETEPLEQTAQILEMELLPLDPNPYEILLQLFNFGVEFMGNIIEEEIFMVD